MRQIIKYGDSKMLQGFQTTLKNLNPDCHFINYAIHMFTYMHESRK